MKTPTVQQAIKARNRVLRWYRGCGQDYRNVKAAWDVVIEILKNGGDMQDCEKVLSTPASVPNKDSEYDTCVLVFNTRR